MRCPRRSDADRGAVTVEAAIAVGAIVLVAAAVIAAVATVLASVRCVDAARELARAASRGDTDRGRAAAARIAPSGAGMDVRTDGETIEVVVTAAPVGLLPVEVSGSATGLLEPGVVRDITPPVPDSPPPEEDGAAPEPPAQQDGPTPDDVEPAGAERARVQPAGAVRTGVEQAGEERTAAEPAAAEPGAAELAGGEPAGGEPVSGEPVSGELVGARPGNVVVAHGGRDGGTATGPTGVGDDRGSATVWAVGVIAALLVLGTAGIDLASAVRARHVAESAADLAALAAAGRASEGTEAACGIARASTERNGAVLRDCRLDGWDAIVLVEVDRGWTMVGRGPAGAAARAGPAPADAGQVPADPTGPTP